LICYKSLREICYSPWWQIVVARYLTPLMSNIG
jgi:hypothetical protein